MVNNGEMVNNSITAANNEGWDSCFDNVWMYDMFSNVSHSVVFWTGSALKVLGVGDGKIPTKKVNVSICHSEKVKF